MFFPTKSIPGSAIVLHRGHWKELTFIILANILFSGFLHQNKR